MISSADAGYQQLLYSIAKRAFKSHYLAVVMAHPASTKRMPAAARISSA